MLEAVVEKARLSARGEGVRHGILGVRVRQRNPGLKLVGGQDRGMRREDSPGQLPCQVAVGGEEPLANRVLGDPWIIFATQAQQRDRTKDEGQRILSTFHSVSSVTLASGRSLTPAAWTPAGPLPHCLETLWQRGCFLSSAG